MANYHLVILKKSYLDAILNNHKKIELRLTKSRHHGFGRVFAGDKLFIKESSGPVCATATVEAVKNHENLTPEKILEIKQRYNHQIGGNDEYTSEKSLAAAYS